MLGAGATYYYGRQVLEAAGPLQEDKIVNIPSRAGKRDIAEVLRAAMANAQQKEGFGGDVDRLYVSACYADQGPSAKRIRPAPRGR